MLQSGELDAVLVGAVDLNCDERNLATLKPLLQFSPGGRVRPFDQKADGTLPGEGAVALVLKRADDALARNDRIYAIIKGIGSAAGAASGDTPFCADADSYRASMQKAFQSAGWTPDQIQLLETHGSGIPAQDQLEAQALHDFLDQMRPQQRQCHRHRHAEARHRPYRCRFGSGFHGQNPRFVCIIACWRRQLILKCRCRTIGAEGISICPPEPPTGPTTAATGPGALWWRQSPQTATACMPCCRRPLPAGEKHHQKKACCNSRPVPCPGACSSSAEKDRRQLLDNIERLEASVRTRRAPGTGTRSMAQLAGHWHTIGTPEAGFKKLSIVTRSEEALLSSLSEARQAVASKASLTMKGHGGVSYFEHPPADKGRIAFVYPGSGNHYIGMGRTLGLHWPQVLRDMEESTERFQAQMLPRWYDPWRVDWRPGWRQEAYDALVADSLLPIFGQVLFGGQMTGVLKQFRLTPDAVIGYSLGESAGLFAMGAWSDRGQMLDRLSATDLFKTELSGPCNTLRKAWGLPADLPVEWVVAAVNRDAIAVDRAIAGLAHVRRLIVNTPNQCVIGGLAAQVAAAIDKMSCEAVYLDGVVTVHCDGRPAGRRSLQKLAPL